MAFRPGSGPISSSILKTVRSGGLLALNGMEGCGCVRVQGLKPGAAGHELVSHPFETIRAGFVEKVFCGFEADAGVTLIGDFSTDQLLNARIILNDCNTKSLGGLLH